MKKREFQEDPELGDDTDPEYKLELFETYKEMGWKPENLTDPQEQKEYADWLAKP